MKQYVIDQLRESDFYDIQGFLDGRTQQTSLEGIYRVELPVELYSNLQSEHTKCQPYYFAIHLSRNEVAFEFLIRSLQFLRCTCIGYATPRQRDYILDFADIMLDELQIKI